MGAQMPSPAGDQAMTGPNSVKDADDGRQTMGPTPATPAQGSAAPPVFRAAQPPTTPVAGDSALREAGAKDAGLTNAAGSADPTLTGAGSGDMALSDSRAGEGRGAADPVATRAESLPRATAAQIADVARRLADGPVEVSLSPEELGRVRMSLHGSDGQMTVQIMAERPETLDLLRRHIDLLAAELRQQGFADLTFSFSGGDAGGSGTAAEAETGARGSGAGDHIPRDVPATDQTPHPDARAHAAPPGTGLDLRL
jgi:flagellar hook-length control protein FliK